MIGQPLGCFLALLIGVISVVIGLILFWCANVVHPGLFTSSFGTVWAAFGVGVFIFPLLLGFGRRLEIRAFFKKRGVKIQRIRRFPNHYLIDYLESGKIMSGKWPKDFEK